MRLGHILKGKKRFLLKLEIIYDLIVTLILGPIISVLLKVSMKASNFNHIGSDNLKAYMLNPVTWICAFILAILVTYVTLVNIVAIILCLYSKNFDRKQSLIDLIIESSKRSIACLRRGGVGLGIFLLIVIPWVNFFSVSQIINNIQIPEFIQDFINNNTPLFISVTLLEFILLFFTLRWCFTLHDMVLKNYRLLDACIDSSKLHKRHFFISVIRIIVSLVIAYTMIYLVIGVVCIAVVGLETVFVPLKYMRMALLITLYLCISLVSAISILFSVPISISVLSVEYDRLNHFGGKNIRPEIQIKRHSLKVKNRLALCTIIVIIIAGIFRVVAGLSEKDIESLRTEIVAHRGSSVYFPENSIPAFEAAILEHADWIELDVHQTSDGVIVVTHDSSLKRIANIKKEVWELTYDELLQYDVGSWFDSEFSYLRVATLDEVMDLCKGKIKLNIELKPTGNERDFEEHVIEIVRKHGYEEECELASLNKDTVKRIKELAPDINTIYILTVASGDPSDYYFADALSIEESFATKSFIQRAHQCGKKVYAWTVNRANNASKLLDCNLDGIITDNPVMIQEVMATGNLRDNTIEMVDEIMNLINKED